MGFCLSANYFGLTSHKEFNKQCPKHLHLSNNSANYALYSSQWTGNPCKHMNGAPLLIKTCSIHCARLHCQQLDAPNKSPLLRWLVYWSGERFTVCQIPSDPRTFFFRNFCATHGLFSKITSTPPLSPSICKSVSQAFFQSVCRVFCTVISIVLRGHYLISLLNWACHQKWPTGLRSAWKARSQIQNGTCFLLLSQDTKK
jgi:hypothetical protein